MPNIVDYNHPTCSRRAFLGLAGAGLLSAAASLGLAGCGPQNAKASADSSAKGNAAQKVQSTTLFAFDTVVTISAQCSKKLLNTVSERCTYFENHFSRTVEGSDIWNINNAAGAPVEVAPETAAIIKDAIKYAEESDGLFDITIGAVSSLWDFVEGVKPDDAAIQAALPHVDYRTITVEGNTVTLADPEAKLDLGGIAKGYITDDVVSILKEGGDIAAQGYDYLDMFLGFMPGSIGEISALALLIGGAYLLIRKVISWRIPVAFIGTVAILTFIFPRYGYSNLDWMLYNLLSGGLVLGAFFMATDYSSSPVTLNGQLLYGFGCGALTVLIRYFGGFPEGVSFAILIMNLCSWAIDKGTRGRQFGVTKEDLKAAKKAAKEAKA